MYIYHTFPSLCALSKSKFRSVFKSACRMPYRVNLKKMYTNPRLLFGKDISASGNRSSHFYFLFLNLCNILYIYMNINTYE